MNYGGWEGAGVGSNGDARVEWLELDLWQVLLKKHLRDSSHF